MRFALIQAAHTGDWLSPQTVRDVGVPIVISGVLMWAAYRFVSATGKWMAERIDKSADQFAAQGKEFVTALEQMDQRRDVRDREFLGEVRQAFVRLDTKFDARFGSLEAQVQANMRRAEER